MHATEVLEELKKLGNEQTKKTWMAHGAPEPVFGVRIGDMKTMQKKLKIKKDYRLALDLFDSGNADAMYFAGLIADDDKMTRKDLQKWAKTATWSMLAQYAVAWTASESQHGWELGLEWIESKKEHIAVSGWSTLGCIISIKPDEELDLGMIKKLLDRVQREIHTAPNLVRYVMNGFVIGVGSFVKDLHTYALQVAKKIGKVDVDMGDTSCQTPDAASYLTKVKQKGYLGKKRKMARC